MDDLITTPPLRRFAFDTVFDAVGDVAYAPPRAKQSFTPEEVEAIRATSFAAGERAATAQAERDVAVALNEIAAAARDALATLAGVAHEHRTGATELALAVGKKIAGAALDAFPEAPAVAALHSLAREIEQQPRLIVRAPADLAARLQKALSEAADQMGFPGQILAKPDHTLPLAAFVLDWGDGRAAFDPVETAARVGAALEAALAAEGLHGEPLLPGITGDY